MALDKRAIVCYNKRGSFGSPEEHHKRCGKADELRSYCTIRGRMAVASLLGREQNSFFSLQTMEGGDAHVHNVSRAANAIVLAHRARRLFT